MASKPTPGSSLRDIWVFRIVEYGKRSKSVDKIENPEGLPPTRVLTIAKAVNQGLKSVAAMVLSGDSANSDAEVYMSSYSQEMRAALDEMAPREIEGMKGLIPKDIRTLWIVLCSHWDPEAGALMDAAAGEPCQGHTDVEVMERMECHSLEERLELRRSLSHGGALVSRGWCQVTYSVTGRLQAFPTRKGTELFFSGVQEGEPSPDITEGQNHGSPSRLSDLVLAPGVLEEVQEVVEAARGREIALAQWGFAGEFSRGLAISALFDGEPGTGKTLSAEVLAGELNRPLQRVNVARILDKYVGGTQKNIEAAFEEASRTGSVLLFDEADALFAKRLNVESSQDRHANLEINLLLEWMERFDGVVVLTTNLRQGIDKAFERRIGYKVHFPFPGVKEREALWRKLIPSQTPVEGELDYEVLAESYELSGGSIKNALLRAAYKSAARGKGLTQESLREAAERECVASGKLVHSPSSEGGLGFSI